MDIKDTFVFCPRCGANFTKHEKYLKCDTCDLSYYLNPKPASSVILYNKNKEFLFGVRADEPSMGLLDEIGGFVDEGETAEQAAIRETLEEINIRIQEEDLQYVGSYEGDYKFQEIIYKVLNICFKAEIPADAVIKPSDDVTVVKFLKLEDIKEEELAFPWVKDLISDLKMH